MKVEIIIKKSISTSQSNFVITIGKRKEEAYSPALLLQDVFSDPANQVGWQQKTSCRPKLDGENQAQLSEIEKEYSWSEINKKNINY